MWWHSVSRERALTPCIGSRQIQYLIICQLYRNDLLVTLVIPAIACAIQGTQPRQRTRKSRGRLNSYPAYYRLFRLRYELVRKDNMREPLPRQPVLTPTEPKQKWPNKLRTRICLHRRPASILPSRTLAALRSGLPRMAGRKKALFIWRDRR